MDLEAIIRLSCRLLVDQAEQSEPVEELEIEAVGADPRTPIPVEQGVGPQPLVALLGRAAQREKRDGIVAVLSGGR